MTLIRTLALSLVALAAAACSQLSSAPPMQAASEQPAGPTILISIDGFRAEYLDRGVTPTLSRLASEGARASMRPSFPSVTFPNHYTLITGRRPDRNGMVNNRFEDPAIPGVQFYMGDSAVAQNPAWWDEAVPLWVSAERQHIPSATMFWPGSDYAIGGVRPTDWRAFDKDLPSFARVDQLLNWLDVPAANRPRIATLYFDLVDTAGHNYGPFTPEVDGAAAEVDAAVARLMTGLEKRRLNANIVIVADHGMAPVSEERLIMLDDKVAASAAKIIWDGPFAGIQPLDGHAAEVEKALVGRSQHGECWRKQDIPAKFHYGANPRVPGVICLADIGWLYRTNQFKHTGKPEKGAHGFDPYSPEMAALFIAHGPAFKHGVRLASFDNVSVYPLLAKLAGIAPEAGDGSLADTAAALAR